jgi:hypothetical protein
MTVYVGGQSGTGGGGMGCQFFFRVLKSSLPPSNIPLFHIHPSTINSQTYMYLSVANDVTILSIYSAPKQNTRVIKQDVSMREIRTIY